MIKRAIQKIACAVFGHDIKTVWYIDNHGNDDSIEQCAKCKKMW